MEVGHCNTCGVSNSAIKQCIGCKTAQYCSRECQKKDWVDHKHVCHPLLCERLKRTCRLHMSDLSYRDPRFVPTPYMSFERHTINLEKRTLHLQPFRNVGLAPVSRDHCLYADYCLVCGDKVPTLLRERHENSFFSFFIGRCEIRGHRCNHCAKEEILLCSETFKGIKECLSERLFLIYMIFKHICLLDDIICLVLGTFEEVIGKKCCHPPRLSW